jgi:hypothetical protein
VRAIHQCAEFREALAQAIGDSTPFRVRGLLRLLREGGADGGRHHRPLLRADMGQRIAHGLD